jgi:hypothetical protein
MLTTYFSRNTEIGTFFSQIKSGHFINVQLSKNFFKTQTHFYDPPFILKLTLVQLCI